MVRLPVMLERTLFAAKDRNLLGGQPILIFYGNGKFFPWS